MNDAWRALLSHRAAVAQPWAAHLGHPPIEGSHPGRPDATNPGYGFFPLARRAAPDDGQPETQP